MRDRTPSYFKIETVFLKSTEYRTLSDAAKDVYQLLCSWVLENRKDVIDERSYDGLLAFFRRLAADRKRTTIENCLKQFLERRLIVVLSEGMIYIRGLRRMHENNKFRFEPCSDDILDRISVYRSFKIEGKNTSNWFSFDALKDGQKDYSATLRQPYGSPRGTIETPKGNPRETLRQDSDSVSNCPDNKLQKETVHKCDTNAQDNEHICAIPHHTKNVLDEIHLERKKDQQPFGSSPPPENLDPPHAKSPPPRSVHSHDSKPRTPELPKSTAPKSAIPDTPGGGKRPLPSWGEEFLQELHEAMSRGEPGIPKAQELLKRRMGLNIFQALKALKTEPQRLCEWCYSAMTEGRNPTGLLVQYLKSRPDFRDLPHIYGEVKRILFEPVLSLSELMDEALSVPGAK